MRKFFVSIVCLWVLLANIESAYASPAALGSVVQYTSQYWDDLYKLWHKSRFAGKLDDAARAAKIAISKGDDFYRFVKTADKLEFDNLLEAVVKLPISQRAPLLLEIATARGVVKPSKMLQLKKVAAGLSGADDIIRKAITNGDDVGDALHVASKVRTAQVADKADDAAKVVTTSAKATNKADDVAKGSLSHYDGTLKANAKYKTGEFNYTYETDAGGRIAKVHADELHLKRRNGRLPHNPNTPGKKAGDDAGHLIGDRFGGSPDLDNMVSQSAKINRRGGEWYTVEEEIATALKKGKSVTDYNIHVKYVGDADRPSEFVIRYKIDGVPYFRVILN
jgi:hypothetical protein